MYQSIITFDCQAFDTEERLEPVWSLLERWDSLELADYDLNQMEQWRAWDPQRAWVDALTQRTQLFRARGPRSLVMIAMGKHGEPPTVVVESTDDIDELESMLAGLPPTATKSVQVLRDGVAIAEWSGEPPIELRQNQT